MPTTEYALFQLADDAEAYGAKSGWWMLCSGDLEDEIDGPFPTLHEAEAKLDELLAAAPQKTEEPK